ncbi:MAG: nucleotidyltransferase domain-containing protein [Phycisphaerales bacterium]
MSDAASRFLGQRWALRRALDGAAWAHAGGSVPAGRLSGAAEGAVAGFADELTDGLADELTDGWAKAGPVPPADSEARAWPADARCTVRGDAEIPAAAEVSIPWAAIVGSRGQGLATESSDVDRRGVYVAGPAVHCSLDGPPEQLVHDADQCCFWEYGKFLRLLGRSDPMALETLYAGQDDWCAGWFAAERDGLRDAGAGQSAMVISSFGAYADRQAAKLERRRARDGTFPASRAMHLVRVLMALDRFVADGQLAFVVEPNEREELLAIKAGRDDWPVIAARCDGLRASIAAGTPARAAVLPATPDRSILAASLVRVRRRVFGRSPHA